MFDPCPVLSDTDAHRLLLLGLAAWDARGEAEAADGAGRSWVFAMAPGGGGLLVEASAGARDGVAYAAATVGPATLGSEFRGVALVGAMAGVAARLAVAA